MSIDNITTWRLYSAEQSVGLGDPVEDVHAARAMVRKIKRSAWWRENVTESQRIAVEVAGRDLGDDVIISFAQPNSDHLVTRWKISLHPEMLNDLVLLHELAHCIAPRWSPSPKRRRKNQLHSHAPLRIHGAGFAGAMAELVREFGKGAVHDELRVAYEHFDVPVMTLEEYREAVSASLVAERDIATFNQEAADYWAAMPKTPPPPDGWRIPESLWGDWIMLCRRQQGRIGLDRLAAAVSPVEKCKRSDIQALEDSKSFPDDVRLRRIAMCLAVFFHLDPIYMRYQLGLVRWDCGIELDELREINADWVALVDRMNDQLEARPPKWVVEGER